MIDNDWSDSEEYIKDVINEMLTQDNRATALPYYYQIKDFKEVSASDDATEYYWIDDGEKGPHHDDLWLYLCDHYGSEVPEALLHFGSDFDSKNEAHLEYLAELFNMEKWYYEKREVFKGFFLTERSAKKHLKENSYHYTNEACTYIFHSWRNPEFEKFLMCVADLVGLEYKLRR